MFEIDNDEMIWGVGKVKYALIKEKDEKKLYFKPLPLSLSN